MKILVTAFDPFGGLDTNSSMMTLERIRDNVDNISIDKMIVPTLYKESAKCVIEKAQTEHYDGILCLGQAGGRKSVTVEVIGINFAYDNIGDNNNVRYDGQKLDENGENALFSTMPVKQMVEAAILAGFEASLSVSAGAFVCNSLLYLLLKSGCAEKIGFVHLPYATEQGKDEFSMNAGDMAKCVEEMIKII